MKPLAKFKASLNEVARVGGAPSKLRSSRYEKTTSSKRGKGFRPVACAQRIYSLRLLARFARVEEGLPKKAAEKDLLAIASVGQARIWENRPHESPMSLTMARHDRMAWSISASSKRWTVTLLYSIFCLFATTSDASATWATDKGDSLARG